MDAAREPGRADGAAVRRVGVNHVAPPPAVTMRGRGGYDARHSRRPAPRGGYRRVRGGPANRSEGSVKEPSVRM